MDEYPPLNLDHLRTLTDTTGIIQHATYSIPNRKTGYTTDDNARALVVALQYYEHMQGRGSLRLISTYLSFLHFAQRPDGKFRNFMSYEQNFLDNEGSEDCFGRSVAACAYTLCTPVHENIKRTARHLLDRARPWFNRLRSLRGKAHLMCGLYFMARADGTSEHVRDTVRTICDFYQDCYRAESAPDWRWFEPILAYTNALMPATLFLGYEMLGESRWLEVARESLDFLYEATTADDHLDLVGNEGWWVRGSERPRFDQQPVDAAAYVEACLAAWRATREDRYRQWAVKALDWLLGKNAHGLALYDPATGGCCDALTQSGVNWNQGAESTIAFLHAYLSMLLADALPGAAPAVVSNHLGDL
ncbi:MAG: glycosyltransferase [Armatimonadota bacterium]|nr:MAG: glycosyltransferase [Armatimonadota bacterium]